MLDDARNADAEIAAIFARLQDEVRSGPPTATSDRGEGPPRRARLVARSEAERTWAVTAERPFEHRPGRRGRLRGHLLIPAKHVLRRLMRWYVEPMAAHQRSFNLAVLRLVDELAERTEADVNRLEARIQALEQRLAPDQPESRR
jgi:hypothetical protein